MLATKVKSQLAINHQQKKPRVKQREGVSLTNTQYTKQHCCSRQHLDKVACSRKMPTWKQNKQTVHIFFSDSEDEIHRHAPAITTFKKHFRLQKHASFSHQKSPTCTTMQSARNWQHYNVTKYNNKVSDLATQNLNVYTIINKSWLPRLTNCRALLLCKGLINTVHFYMLVKQHLTKPHLNVPLPRLCYRRKDCSVVDYNYILEWFLKLAQVM